MMVHPCWFPSIHSGYKPQMNLRLHIVMSVPVDTFSFSPDAAQIQPGFTLMWSRQMVMKRFFLSGWAVGLWDMRSSLSHAGGHCNQLTNQAGMGWSVSDCILHTENIKVYKASKSPKTFTLWIIYIYTVYTLLKIRVKMPFWTVNSSSKNFFFLRVKNTLIKNLFPL